MIIRAILALTVFLCIPNQARAAGAGDQNQLSRCLSALTKDFPHPDENTAITAGHTKTHGWVVFIVSNKSTYSCEIPAPIEACFAGNSNCTVFDFALAIPGSQKGVVVTFRGQDIENVKDLLRLDSGFKSLPYRTVNSQGVIHRPIKNTTNPILGLKCVQDKSAEAREEIVSAIQQSLKRGTGVLPPRCSEFAPSSEPSTSPGSETPPPAGAR